MSGVRVTREDRIRNGYISGSIGVYLQKRWLYTIESNIGAAGVCVGEVEYRDKLRSRTRVADTK